MAGLKIELPAGSAAQQDRSSDPKQKRGTRPVIGAAVQSVPPTPANDTRMPDESLERAKAATERMKSLQRTSSLELVLQVERQVRQTRSIRDFALLAANETRKLSNARQIIVLTYSPHSWRWQVEAVSSMASVSRSTPFAIWMCDLARSLCENADADEVHAFSLADYSSAQHEDAAGYPFQHALWTCLRDRDGRILGAILQLREMPWEEADQVVTSRLAECFAHHLELLNAPRFSFRTLNPLSWGRTRLGAAGITLAILLALLIPVSMTTLAPMEVIARSPQIIAAPIDGVVDRIVVEPNARVTAGDVLIELEDTQLRNALSIAEQKVEVARAKYQRASQAAFSDPNARRELTVSKAEYDLARSERDYARELLSQTRVRATSDGVAIYANPDEWKGRPVTVGEQVLQIAQPGDVAFRVDVPVADAIVLKADAKVRVFLDARPLESIDGTISSVSYQAEPNTTQQLVYRVRADVAGGESARPRIGSRGTAQLYGETVSLGFYLFRRPISAVRQFLGL